MKNRLINFVNLKAGHYYSLKGEASIHIKQCCSRLKVRLSRQDGFGMNEILGIAATLIIAAFIVIPQLSSFSKTIMEGLSSWWTTTVKNSLFKTGVS